MRSEVVDTRESLVVFLDGIGECVGQPPALYVDLEGNNLSRHGTLSLVTILVQPQERIYLIDITTLKTQAFTTASACGQTLKKLLEDDGVIKVFFDIRNDSDALFSLYGIRVQGIEDLQLMELASRRSNRKHLNGLSKCIEKDSTISLQYRRDWQRVKDEGRRLFNPTQGGNFDVFDKRPIPPALQEYCVQDVAFMPQLRSAYLAKLCDAWWSKIVVETKARILLSQSSTFHGQGRHMALGPEGWSHWSPTVNEQRMRRLVESMEPNSKSKGKPHSYSESAIPEISNESGALSQEMVEGMQRMKMTMDRSHSLEE